MKGIFKKRFILPTLVAVVALVLLAFGGENEAVVYEAEEAEEEVSYVAMPENPVKMTGETISVYNWGDYIEPEVLDVFEAETGIRVIY